MKCVCTLQVYIYHSFTLGIKEFIARMLIYKSKVTVSLVQTLFHKHEKWFVCIHHQQNEIHLFIVVIEHGVHGV